MHFNSLLRGPNLGKMYFLNRGSPVLGMEKVCVDEDKKVFRVQSLFWQVGGGGTFYGALLIEYETQ